MHGTILLLSLSAIVLCAILYTRRSQREMSEIMRLRQELLDAQCEVRTMKLEAGKLLTKK